MKVSCIIGTLLLAVPLQFARADEPVRRPGKSKAAWDWSTDERISSRLDPVQVRARVAEAETERRRRPDALRPEIEAMGGTTQFVVDGAKTPELLMPFELFNVLVRASNPDDGAELRGRFRESIVKSGWAEETFWPEVRRLSAAYRAADAESIALQWKMREAAAPERRKLSTSVEAVQLRGCRERTRAMQALRKRFGTAAFDRFLYEAIAPTISIGGELPGTGEASRLRFVEGGCS